jgi:malonyl-CoA O-methyltransferase
MLSILCKPKAVIIQSMTKHLNTSHNQFWSWLTSEISERMAQNLPFIKIEPKKILLIGHFDQSTFKYFSEKYPYADIWSDQKIFNQRSFLNVINPFKKKKISFLDFENEVEMVNFDFVWAGPLRQTVESYPQFFLKIGKCLKNQGLMMFNYLGPDTGREYFHLGLEGGHIGPDMHEIGDLLIQSSFADPVMNMEYLYLEYENSELLLKDLLAVHDSDRHFVNVQNLNQQLTAMKKENEKMVLTMEVVYGHAWKVPKKEPGVTRISPESIKKSYKN